MTDRTNTAPRCGQNDLISGKYSEMRDSVFAYILKKTGDRAEAEDLVQDTFTRLLEYREVICAETVRSFIFRIAGNLVVDWYRRHAHSEKAMEYLGSKGYDISYGARPIKRLLQKELVNELATEIISGKISRDSAVEIDSDGEKLTFNNKK